MKEEGILGCLEVVWRPSWAVWTGFCGLLGECPLWTVKMCSTPTPFTNSLNLPRERRSVFLQIGIWRGSGVGLFF